MTQQLKTDVRPLLERQLQKLGQLRRQRQALEAEENELTASVRSQMSEHGITVVRSAEFEAKLVRRTQLTVKPAALWRRLTRKQFLACVGVRIQDARKHLGDVALRRIAEITENVSLRVSDLQGKQ